MAGAAQGQKRRWLAYLFDFIIDDAVKVGDAREIDDQLFDP